MLDLKKMTYLYAVYRYNGFTKASEALYVSQPTISAAISSLEQELGIKLISRSSKNLTFTPEGELFIQHIQRIITMCDETEKMMRDLSSSVGQHIRFGISQAVSSFLIPQLYSQFMAENPRAQIQLAEGDMYTQIELLQNESLDLVYNALPDEIDADDLTSIPVSSSTLHAVIPSMHPAAKLKKVSLELLAKEELAILGAPSRTSSALLNAFERARLIPNISFSCNHYSCLIEVLNICNYIGIVNVMDGQPFPKFRGFVLRPIAGIDPIPMGFTYKKDKYLSKLCRNLISFVSQIYEPR